MDRSVEEVLPEIIPYLKKICWKYTTHPDEIDDLVSDTCLKVLKSRHLFEGNENDFQKWCSIILRNIYLNNYRKKIYQNTEIIEEGDMVVYSNLQRFSDSTDKELLYSQLKEQVKMIISDSDYRIFMGFVNGFSYDQLAEILDKPLGTIKSRIYVVRDKLKKEINL